MAKTIHYDHGSPSIVGSTSEDPSKMFNRFSSPQTSNQPGIRNLSHPYIYQGPRGGIRQPPPFNRGPSHDSLAAQGFNFSSMSNRPPLRPSFNERPSFRPQARGSQFTGSPIPPQRPNQVYPPTRLLPPIQRPQRFEIPVKELTNTDEEYYTSPPSKLVSLEELLYPPTRDFRPKKIVIILRGLPGSGKTHLAKLIRDKEAEHCGSAPRILSIDDYFMVEKDIVVTDENGKQIKAKEFVYEYEESLEESYRESLLKAFKKTADAPYFKFIIVDAINCLVPHFHEFQSHASSKGFTVYICEMNDKDPKSCVKMNVHNRSLADIKKLSEKWNKTPENYIKLEFMSFLNKISQEEVSFQLIKFNDLIGCNFLFLIKALASSSESNMVEKRQNPESQEDDIIKKKLALGVNPSRDEVEAKEKVKC